MLPSQLRGGNQAKSINKESTLQSEQPNLKEKAVTFLCLILIAMLPRFAGMYAAGPYALAQGDVEAPYLILQSFIYSLITYWMIR